MNQLLNTVTNVVIGCVPGKTSMIDLTLTLYLSCTAAHERVKLTKSHILSRFKNNSKYIPEKCKKHPTEFLKLYCHVCIRSLFNKSYYKLRNVVS